MKVININYIRRVQRGIAFFERQGIDWRSTVQRADFYIGGESICVLGLLFGTFTDGCNHFGWDPEGDTPRRFGLEIFSEDWASGYDVLTNLWKQFATDQLAYSRAGRSFFIFNQMVQL